MGLITADLPMATGVHVPLFSVVLVHFNQKRYIADAIAGFQGQPGSDLESIVVDDAPTDRTSATVPGEGGNRMISPNAVVQTDDIGEGLDITEFAIVRPGVRLGSGVRIHPHVVIKSGVQLEANVEVFPGAYLGKEPKGAGRAVPEEQS